MRVKHKPGPKPKKKVALKGHKPKPNRKVAAKPGPKPKAKSVRSSVVRKIVGHEMPAKARKQIEDKFSVLQKQIDEFGEHVGSFVYQANTEAGLKAMKMINEMLKGIRDFKTEIRVAREALKPIFAG